MDLDKLRISDKPVLNIVFVGHVDAGKSTICGQILVLQDVVDKRTLEKYRDEATKLCRESWYLSFCLDTNPEERDKGKTTEVGTACFELKNRRINILDTPGHKQYVFEMINGANIADVGVLVISARINEFEAGFEKGGQTREHILLMKSSSIQKIIVLVNKMDDPSVNWAESRYNEIKHKIGTYVKNLFPNPLFIPVSGQTGLNIKEKHSLSWYNGPTFFEHLDNIEIETRSNTELIITIIEKIKLMGASMLSGKIESGKIQKDMTVKLVPQNITTTVTGIYTNDDVEMEEGLAGETLKLKLKTDPEDVMTGSKLVSIDNENYKGCTLFTARLTIVEADNIICPGFVCMLHMGLVSVQCKIKEIRSLENKKLRFIRTGAKVLVLIETENTIVLSDSPNNKQKFAIRLGEKTLGVGIVRNIKS